MPESPRRKVVAVPSDRLWLDPAFVFRQLYTQVSTVQYTGSNPVLLAGMNVNRWAIGISGHGATGFPFNVAPWSDIQGQSGWVVQAGEPRWFYLTKHGAIVLSEWYALVPGPGPFRVVEVLRNV